MDPSELPVNFHYPRPLTQETLKLKEQQIVHEQAQKQTMTVQEQLKRRRLARQEEEALRHKVGYE